MCESESAPARRSSPSYWFATSARRIALNARAENGLKAGGEALFDDDDRAELLASTWDKDGAITYGWGWQAGVEAVYNKWIGK
jgi:hypothetical protein